MAEAYAERGEHKANSWILFAVIAAIVIAIIVAIAR
jgi:hypothetical protein